MNDGEPDYEWDAGFEAGYRTALEEQDSALRALVEAASEAEYLFAHGVGAMSSDRDKHEHNVAKGREILDRLRTALRPFALRGNTEGGGE